MGEQENTMSMRESCIQDMVSDSSDLQVQMEEERKGSPAD